MGARMRFAGLLTGLVMLTVAAGAAAEAAGRPLVYDVTMARLERYQDAVLRLMTRATVTAHVDGDTFKVEIAAPPSGMNTRETVRFMGVDAPELGDPQGQRARDYVERRVGAGPVYLAFDFRRRDRYDRLLAFVYLRDGALLNAELIENGMAALYRRDPLMYFYDQFGALELERSAAGPCDPAAGVVIAALDNAGRDEHVLLRNDGCEAVDLSGWRVRDDDGDGMTIPRGVRLDPGGTWAACSGTGCVGRPEPARRLVTRNIWGNGGDLACLRDRAGAVVDSYGYGKQSADTCRS